MNADPQQSTPDAGGEILQSWKEIASYLGRSVRAVQLWERDEGLPVHRHQHDRQGSVYAYRSELDAWRQSRTLPAPKPGAQPRRLPARSWIAIAAALAALAGLLWWMGHESSTAKASPFPFAEHDWVMVAALENGTGEKIFDGSVEYLLERELAEGQQLHVAPRERVADVLMLMRRGPETRVDRRLALEVARRDGAIRSIAAPHLEKIGSRYVLGVDVIDARTGARVAAFTATANDQNQIASTVSESANEVRKALRRSPPPQRAANERLPTVTTSSFRALQLYTEADRLIAFRDNAGAEKLLRQAIEEDPQFASAYIHLAHALRNEGRPADEYLPLAERALALSRSASERERYFILGSHADMSGNLEQAVLHYRMLLDHDPDHFWGVSNLGALLKFRMYRAKEAAPYRIRGAELRPNLFWANFAAGESLALLGKRKEALRHIARAVELITPADERRQPEVVAWARLYAAHDAWLDGDMKRVVAELEAWTRRARTMDTRNADVLLEHIAHVEVAIGRTDRADVLVRFIDDPVVLARLQGNLSCWRGDRQEARSAFRPLLSEGRRPSFDDLVRMADCGLHEEVRKYVSSWTPGFPRRVVLGVADINGGSAARGTATLEDLLPTWSAGVGVRSAHFTATETLARRLEQEGRIDDAIAALEAASRHRWSAVTIGKVEFMDLRRHLARLHRATGRTAEAEAVEAELKRLQV